MKHAVVLLEGAATAGQTPGVAGTLLADAHTPVLRTLCRAGRVGRAALWPTGSPLTIETAVLTLAGYDASATGVPSAAFVAAGLRQSLSESDAVFFARLVTLDTDGPRGILPRRPKRVLLDPAAGGITETESKTLGADLLAHLRAALPDVGASLDLVPVAGNSFVLIERSGADYRSVVAPAPELDGDEPAALALPSGNAAATEVLSRLLSLAESFLARHEINIARVEQGLLPANALWVWDPSRRPGLTPLAASFPLSTALTTPSVGVAGVATCIACPVTRVKNPSPRSVADAAIPALAQRDLVIAHVPVRSAPGVSDALAAEALAQADLKLIAPLADHVLHGKTPGRLLVVATPVGVRPARRGAPPQSVIAIIGGGFAPTVERAFTDADAAASELVIDSGRDLLEFFLSSGRSAPAPVIRVKRVSAPAQERSL